MYGKPVTNNDLLKVLLEVVDIGFLFRNAPLFLAAQKSLSAAGLYTVPHIVPCPFLQAL